MLVLGIEHHRNDSGKEFDGNVLLSHDDIDDLRNALKFIAPLLSSLMNQDETTQSAFKQNKPGTYEIVKENRYWFHIYDPQELEKLPKNMFDQQELDTAPRDFDTVMSDASGGQLASPVPTVDLFFNKDGDEIASPPEPWMLETGLY